MEHTENPLTGRERPSVDPITSHVQLTAVIHSSIKALHWLCFSVYQIMAVYRFKNAQCIAKLVDILSVFYFWVFLLWGCVLWLGRAPLFYLGEIWMPEHISAWLGGKTLGKTPLCFHTTEGKKRGREWFSELGAEDLKCPQRAVI